MPLPRLRGCCIPTGEKDRTRPEMLWMLWGQAPSRAPRLTGGETMMTRRALLSAATAGALTAPLARASDDRPGRKKMAIVTTEWRDRSHAWHMGERFLAGYP